MMHRHIRICVTGGREYNDTDKVVSVLADLIARFGYCIDVAHGDATGLDRLFGYVAKHEHDLIVKTWPADWDVHGRSAGPIRNRQMLTEFDPDILISFPGGRGTAHCTAEARKRGIPIRYVE